MKTLLTGVTGLMRVQSETVLCSLEGQCRHFLVFEIFPYLALTEATKYGLTPLVTDVFPKMDPEHLPSVHHRNMPTVNILSTDY